MTGASEQRRPSPASGIRRRECRTRRRSACRRAHRWFAGRLHRAEPYRLPWLPLGSTCAFRAHHWRADRTTDLTRYRAPKRSDMCEDTYLQTSMLPDWIEMWRCPSTTAPAQEKTASGALRVHAVHAAGLPRARSIGSASCAVAGPMGRSEQARPIRHLWLPHAIVCWLAYDGGVGGIGMNLDEYLRGVPSGGRSEKDRTDGR